MTGAIDDEILTTNNFFQDAFGVGVVHNTRNKLDLPSTYNFRPERYSVYVNGSRAEFGETAFQNHFTDKPSIYQLNADAGDVVELRVRERPRYVPGFEILYGNAWYMANALPSGGVIRLGLRDKSDGNKFSTEYTPSDVESVIEKASTETVRQKITDGYMVDRDISFSEKLKQPQIDRNKANMYGVGAHKPGKSYLVPTAQDTVTPSSGNAEDAAVVQKNQNMLAEHLRTNDATVSEEVGVGNVSAVNTEEFNMNMFIELDLSNASSGADLNVLSQQYIVIGDVTPTTAPKPVTFENLGGSISTGWNDGLVALRTDPSRDNVDLDLTILGITPTVEMTLYALAFDPEEIISANSFSESTFESNFAPVKEQAGYDAANSVLEANGVNSPFSYPTQSYTDPFGNSLSNQPDKSRLVNRASETSGSNQGGGTAPPGERTETKRTIFNDDVVLLVPYGHDGASGGALDIVDIGTEQDM